MLQYIVKILIQEIVTALLKAGQDYIALQRKKKEDKDLVKGVMSEKDPKVRAARIRNLLD